MNPTLPTTLLAQVFAFHNAEDNIGSIKLFLSSLSEYKANICLSVPYTQIGPIKEAFADQGMVIGANEMLSANPLDFPGTISGRMAAESGVAYVMIPVSEAGGKNDANLKINAALQHHLIPYICIVESWEEHHDGLSKQSMMSGLKNALEGLSEENLRQLKFVYNARWILSALWEASSQDLASAYTTVIEALKEVSPTLSPGQLLLSLPVFSPELPSLVASLQQRKEAIGGFFFGELGPSTYEMQKPFAIQQVPPPEAAAVIPPEKKPVAPPQEEGDPAAQAESAPAVVKKRRTRAKPDA